MQPTTQPLLQKPGEFLSLPLSFSFSFPVPTLNFLPPSPCTRPCYLPPPRIGVLHTAAMNARRETFEFKVWNGEIPPIPKSRRLSTNLSYPFSIFFFSRSCTCVFDRITAHVSVVSNQGWIKRSSLPPSSFRIHTDTPVFVVRN